VGLSKEQIRRFHWKEGAQQMMTGQERLVERIEVATHHRQEILKAGDEVPFVLKHQKLALADESLGLVRFAGNVAVAAFFAGDNDKQRQAKRGGLLAQLTEYLRTGDMKLRPTAAEKALHAGPKGMPTALGWDEGAAPLVDAHGTSRPGGCWEALLTVRAGQVIPRAGLWVKAVTAAGSRCCQP
jgi:hypothetical protein